MDFHGFVRVAAAVPSVRVADADYNVQRIRGLLKRAESEQVAVVVFPELSLTGYTCGDLFHQTVLQRSALDALARKRSTKAWSRARSASWRAFSTRLRTRLSSRWRR